MFGKIKMWYDGLSTTAQQQLIGSAIFIASMTAIFVATSSVIGFIEAIKMFAIIYLAAIGFVGAVIGVVIFLTS